MKTYQYHDAAYPADSPEDNATRWITAPSEESANSLALLFKWNQCGGAIFDQRKTAELLAESFPFGGIDIVIADDIRATAPAVLITVLGGVADYETTGGVEVGTIDFDNIKDGDGPVALSGALLQLARADNCLHEGEHYYDEATDPPHRYRNFYRHCGVEWDDTWSCMCNDKCPKCGAEIEPYNSEDI